MKGAHKLSFFLIVYPGHFPATLYHLNPLRSLHADKVGLLENLEPLGPRRYVATEAVGRRERETLAWFIQELKDRPCEGEFLMLRMTVLVIEIQAGAEGRAGGNLRDRVEGVMDVCVEDKGLGSSGQASSNDAR